MKKELTPSQKQIIKDITTEFEKINQEKKTQKSGGLIDMGILFEQREKDIEQRNELMILNEKRREMFFEYIDTIVEKLNNDFNGYGLKCFRDRFSIYIDKTEKIDRRVEKGGYLGDNYTYIQFHYEVKCQNFESNIESFSYYTPNLEYIKCMNGSVKHQSVEEVVKDNTFLYYMKRLINTK